MKKIFIIALCMLLCIAVSFAAQKKTEVLLKFSKQEGLMRIVLEAEETYIAKIKVTTSPSQIKIDFPEPFNLKAPKDLPFELVPSDKSLGINLKEKGEIKFFRLSSPERLVLDIKKLETQKKEIPSEKQSAFTDKQSASILSKGFVIDAGHGGYDFGITFGNVSEKDISLSLAKDLDTALSKKGKKAFLVRRVDQYISLTDRINLVNQKSPDVFISFHSSMSNNFVLYSPKVEEQGSNEIIGFYSLSLRQKKFIGKSKVLSDSIEKAIKDEFKADIIRREMPLPILNSVGAPSVLIEYPSPRFIVYDQQTRIKLINAIMNGIEAYGQ